MCSLLHKIIFVGIPFEWNLRVIILSAIALILSILCVFISELKIMNKITLGINHKSTHDDIWQDVIDYKNGTTLRIVCDNVIYTGILIEHEEKGNDSWFILEDYIVEEDGTYYKSDKICNNCRIAINLKNVKRVELYYGNKEKSKLRKWLEKNKFFGRFFKDVENNEEQDN